MPLLMHADYHITYIGHRSSSTLAINRSDLQDLRIYRFAEPTWNCKHGYRVKMLRTDRGPEYAGEINPLLNLCGIVHPYSVPHSLKKSIKLFLAVRVRNYFMPNFLPLSRQKRS